MGIIINRNKTKEGICPLCGHKQINYSNYDIMKSTKEVLVDWTCPRCHAYGSVDFKLTFSSFFNIFNEEQKEIEIL